MFDTPKTSDTHETNYVYKVYRNIIGLGLLLHIIYTLLFGMFNYTLGCLYNIGSVIFYSIMLYIAIKKRRYALVVTLIHMECSLFVFLQTLMYGWDGSFYMLLVAMASLVYFCPYKRSYIPYLISVFHFTVFFILRIYTLNYNPWFVINPIFTHAIFFCNCIGSFCIILYVAYVSKVNAAVSQKELMIQNDNLQQLADYDQLTGLYNRHYLKEIFKNGIKENKVLAIGDIDDFKMINDRYGHICGDQILRELSEQMQQFFGSDVFLCRWGGEEFVFVFSKTSLEKVQRELIDFCQWIEEYDFHHENNVIHITLTFGISENNDEMNLNQWIEQADQLLYKGKHDGKNKVLIK